MRHILILTIIFSLFACKKSLKENTVKHTPKADIVIAFGSCNNQNLKNPFWAQIAAQKPDLWIWGGDAIYCDTEDMVKMKSCYERQKRDSAYATFLKKVPVTGVWDDHDYGANDGGAEYPMKAEVQQLFYDFIGLDKNDSLRKKPGTYRTYDLEKAGKHIKIFLLDTRYFRSPLTPHPDPKIRYQPNEYGKGTMLGKAQWEWLENELANSKADFNIIMSSIQFLSDKHGFETWGNMPHEVDKLEKILVAHQVKNTFILSGDRHIAEISKKEVEGLAYPLIDFTSSGLTHSYTLFDGEENPYRISEVVSDKNYGILKFNKSNNSVRMEIWGENDSLRVTYKQDF